MADVATQLIKLDELHTAGVISDAEFSIAKQRVLVPMLNSAPGLPMRAAVARVVAPTPLRMTASVAAPARPISQHIDEASGQPYWHNSSTGVTTWHDPEEGDASARQNPIATQLNVRAAAPIAGADAVPLDTSDAPSGLVVEQDLVGIRFTRKLATAPSMLVGTIPPLLFGTLALIVCLGIAILPWFIFPMIFPDEEMLVMKMIAALATPIALIVFRFTGAYWFYVVLQTLCNSVTVRFDASSQKISYNVTPLIYLHPLFPFKVLKTLQGNHTTVANEHVLRVWTPAAEGCCAHNGFFTRQCCSRANAFCCNHPRHAMKVFVPPCVSDEVEEDMLTQLEYPLIESLCGFCDCCTDICFPDNSGQPRGMSADERERELSERRQVAFARVPVEDGVYIQRCLAAALRVEGQAAHDIENERRKSEGKPPAGSQGLVHGRDVLEVLLKPFVVLSMSGGPLTKKALSFMCKFIR